MISELISTSIIKSVAKALLPWTKMYFYVKKKKNLPEFWAVYQKQTNKIIFQTSSVYRFWVL